MRTVVVLAMVLGAGPALACLDDGDCGSGETCDGGETCAEGTCVPSFALPLFPIAGLTAYDAATIAVMDHTGPFYTGCCDDGRGFDLPLAGAQGTGAARVSWGTQRICAVFDAAAAVSADGPGGFHARDAARPDVADRSRASRLGS